MSVPQEGVYQLHLRSETGAIQLLLCQDDLSPPHAGDDSVLPGRQSPLPDPARAPSDASDSVLTASQSPPPGLCRYDSEFGCESGLGDSLLAGCSGPRVKVEPVEAAGLRPSDSPLVLTPEKAADGGTEVETKARWAGMEQEADADSAGTTGKC